MGYEPPSFCSDCGKPYPWQKAKQDAVIELAEMLNLERLEELLGHDIEQLVSDTPRTKVVAYKAKKLLEDAGPTMGTMFRDLFVEILAEAAKKIIYPDAP